MKQSELRQLIREEISKILTEKHWKEDDINPKVKVGDWFGKYQKMKVIYVSKETGAFVIEKPFPHNEFYIFPKEGAKKYNGARDMDTNLEWAIKKADKLK
jgi:hypothetical protein